VGGFEIVYERVCPFKINLVMD